MSETTPSPAVRHYFVDEAGDASLFDRRGRVIIGEPGCSRFFLLGLVDIEQPQILERKISTLREHLVADPYFAKVPSMQAEARKTAVAFHAKDDVPEVRREVFAALRGAQLRFFAVVREKRAVLNYVLERNTRDRGYRYSPNELYDFMVRRLFKERLHKEDEYLITFASRGKTDRTGALRNALLTARQRFLEEHHTTTTSVITVQTSSPARAPGLQVADYLLWALQRLYERAEDRYVELLWPLFRLVQDVDDTRVRTYGEYYSQDRPLTLAATKRTPGI